MAQPRRGYLQGVPAVTASNYVTQYWEILGGYSLDNYDVKLSFPSSYLPPLVLQWGGGGSKSAEIHTDTDQTMERIGVNRSVHRMCTSNDVRQNLRANLQNLCKRGPRRGVFTANSCCCRFRSKCVDNKNCWLVSKPRTIQAKLLKHILYLHNA